MLRRWQLESEKHRISSGPNAGTTEEACHCLRGPGFVRKRRPYGCSRPRCGVCHFEKFYVAKARERRKREAIQFEFAAER